MAQGSMPSRSHSFYGVFHTQGSSHWAILYHALGTHCQCRRDVERLH